MIRSDEQWLSIVDTFHSAAIGAQSWETALRGFADGTGSRSAQLAGFDSNTALTFNIMTNVAKRAAILQATYALTSAEMQITEYLAEGQCAELIAAKRGVALETVRTQIKAIMTKLGVSRQVELVVRLGEL